MVRLNSAAFDWQVVIMCFSDVPVQVSRLCVTAVTVAALIWSFPGVHNGVSPQGVSTGKGLSTSVTSRHILHVTPKGVVKILEVHGLLLRVGIGRKKG